ncbi:MAG: apolipoprotein N-acyltransferase [Nitrospirae bacterium GWB2_47_37]|nr:MAG: apolipoprotein N-acyltransferase [Nitrospirae bacterium GWA2_46_11]OGW23826.1 MAG: apolipoprotein N-acyltransferase [Nitrospirae bacterium GWB2_47_37]HAK88490.1 apolipoprotein N-acyltransferase [Nitrospiraceae bacterium]
MNKLKTKFNRFYGPAIVSGLLLFLSFPKMDIYPLTWVALVPLLVYLYGKDKKTAFKAGFLFGIVYFFGTTYWIYHSINKYGSIPFVPSILLVLLLCLYLSLYPALFSYLYASHIKKSDLPIMFVAPVFWTFLEFVRSYAMTGFPWSSLGYSQYKFLPAIQIADITGIYGVSFLLVAVNGAVADILLLKQRKTERPLYSLIPTLGGFILLSVVLIATFSYGFYRMYQKRAGVDIKAAVIQGNIEQDKKWEPSYQSAVIDVYKELSAAAAVQKPDIIIWPETSVPFIFGKNGALTEDLVSFQRQLDSYLLFGSVQIKDRSAGSKIKSQKSANSAVLLNKDGNVSYIYDKIHLVPFGEYVPLRKFLFFIDKLVVGVGDYAPGDRYIRAVTPFGSFGTLICYEIIFPGLARKFYTKGGDFIVTITNDAWFGKTHGPYQHFSMAVFRAIENRKPVIRAANSGISGFIDSSGRVLSQTELFKRTFLVGNIRTDKTLTAYTKYGDIFSYLCIVCSLLLLLKKRP